MAHCELRRSRFLGRTARLHGRNGRGRQDLRWASRHRHPDRRLSCHGREHAPVLAAFDGTVTKVSDGYPDRETTADPNRPGNEVVIRHESGYVGMYLHLKKDSIPLSVGAAVKAGDRIGCVGSSGTSSGPHLHFQIMDASKNVVDPIEQKMWADPPAYDSPTALMDVVLRRGGFDSGDAGTAQCLDPLPNLTSAMPGESIGICAVLADSKVGDVLSRRIKRPDGTVFVEREFTLPDRRARSSVNVTLGSDRGTWTIEISLNGVLVHTTTFSV